MKSSSCCSGHWCHVLNKLPSKPRFRGHHEWRRDFMKKTLKKKKKKG
jgi:hypothetical protein